jgi:hypothetical protein
LQAQYGAVKGVLVARAQQHLVYCLVQPPALRDCYCELREQRVMLVRQRTQARPEVHKLGFTSRQIPPQTEFAGYSKEAAEPERQSTANSFSGHPETRATRKPTQRSPGLLCSLLYKNSQKVQSRQAGVSALLAHLRSEQSRVAN